MYLAAKSQSSQTPGQPVIVPDPPNYQRSIARVRKQLPTLKNKSEKTLEADCALLFRSLSSQVMDFLIKADWIEADAAQGGVTPSDADVEHAFQTAKRKPFPSDASFRSFLAKTGQTLQDIRFRFRINVTLNRLTAKEKGAVAAQQKAVSAREKRVYLPRTRCATQELMTDCANYRAG